VSTRYRICSSGQSERQYAHWRMSRAWLTSASTLLFLCSTSAIALASDNSSFRIQESGYWTCETTANRQCIYWLDNDHVIFSGTRPQDIETTADGRRTWNYALYIWDLGTNSVVKYADASPRLFCYSDGYIRYLRPQGGESAVVAGPLGRESVSSSNKESAVIRKGQSSSGAWGWNTELSCGQYQPQPPYPLIGVKVALKKGHGFLFLGSRQTPGSAKATLQYFQDQSAKAIDLPLQRWQINAAEIRPVDFRGAYLLLGDQIYNRSDRCVPEGFGRRVYRMSLNGIVEPIQLPPRRELRCHVEWRGVNEVRSGLTVHVNTGRLASSYLYLVRGEQVTTILKGRISSSAVSPNGCKLAVGLSSVDDPRKPGTAEFYRGHLKTVDFCAKGER
jgi:hypothetical protein